MKKNNHTQVYYKKPFRLSSLEIGLFMSPYISIIMKGGILE